MNKLILAKLSAALFIVIASFFSFCGFFAQGATNDTAADKLFYQANAAYKESKYDRAIENYEKLIKSGLESPNLYYNLGNSYFKKGEAGKAIVNYERAKRFIPNDSDLKSNYDYAHSSLNLERKPFGNLFEKLADRLFEGATIKSLNDFVFIFLAYSI